MIKQDAMEVVKCTWFGYRASRNSFSICRLHSVAAVNCGAPRKQGLAIATKLCDSNE